MKQKKQAASTPSARASWVGYYPRRTKTKREKEIAAHRKHKKRLYDRDAYLFLGQKFDFYLKFWYNIQKKPFF